MFAKSLVISEISAKTVSVACQFYTYEALPTHKSLSKQLKPMRKSFAKKITEKKKNNNPVKMTLRIVFRNPLSWCRYGYIMHYCVQLASRHYIEVFNQMKGFNIIICTYNHTELYM